MRMRRSTVIWAGFSVVLGGLSLAACSSDSNSEGGTTPEADAASNADSGSPVADTGAPDTGSTPVVDSGSTPADDAGAPQADAATDAGLADATVPQDAGLADATVTDAGTDAGRDAGVDSGAPVCRNATDIIERSCGACGKQSAVCEATDAGLSLGAFSYCFGERDGGCTPGTEPDGGVPCGRCGRARSVCQNDCTYASGSCIEPPTSVCTPGEKVFKMGLSCPNPGEGRYATCGNDCTFAFGDCLIEETWITVSSTVGGVASRTFTMKSSQTTGRGGTSGTTCTPSSTSTPYEAVVVRNTSSKNLQVSLWDSFPTGSGLTYYDTVMNVFDGETLPASRTTCLGANDTCSTSPCISGSGLGGFPASAPITINAGASILVYTGCWSSSCTTPTNLVLNVKTEVILP
jgi:hypothetical protein